jgi:hypothetical protein
MDEYNLDYLKGFQDFQQADVDTKLGWLDNFSNSMFQEGKLEEARRAQEYRTQLEVDQAVSQPAAQAMGQVHEALFPNADSLKFSIGQETYDKINKGYNDRVSVLDAPADIVQVTPGEYVYTRPNPFGDGALVEYEGGAKFVDAANPRTIKALIETEKLPTIKKGDVFDSVVDKLTPIFQTDGPTIGIETAQQLMQDPEFQTLPDGDQRELVRRFRINRKDFQDPAGVAQADLLLDSMNREYDAKLATRQLGSEKEPWYDFFTNAIDQGSQRWMKQQDRKRVEDTFAASDRLAKSFGPEAQEALKAPGLLDQIRTINDQSIHFTEKEKEVKDLVAGTPLENVAVFNLMAYSEGTKTFQKSTEAYDLRSKALSMIPQTGGGRDFQANQEALKASDASWVQKAQVAAMDMATNPLDVVVNATIESFVSQPLSTAATAALFAIPGGQAAAGATATRFLSPSINAVRMLQGTGTGLLAGMTESGYVYTEELEKARVRGDGTQIPMAEVLSDPKLMSQVNDAAYLRGASIGTVEGVTGFVLPGIMNPLDRRLASRVKRLNKPAGLGTIASFNAAEMGLQGFSEGAGELSAQVASAQDPDVGEVLMEMAAGMAGPDFFSMYQAPKEMMAANQEVEAGFEAEAQKLVAAAKLQASEKREAEVGLDALAKSTTQFQGAYARGIVPQIAIGPVDSVGRADIEIYLEEDDLESQPPPTITEEEGLAELSPVAETQTGTEELVQPAVQPEAIQDVASLVEGQEVSYLSPDGQAQVGPVENLDPATGNFSIAGKPQSFTPGKYFSGAVQPKSNARKLEQGDVLFDGDSFYKYDGEDPADFIVGQKLPDGKIRFDKNDRRELEDGFINDPRVSLYSKPDFDAAQQEYNGRPDPTPEDRFTDILKRTPQKQEPASAPSPQPPAEPVTEDGAVKAPPTPDVNTPILSAPIAKRKTTLVKLRAHAGVVELLKKGVERFNDWMNRTSIQSQTLDSITYAKDGKIHQLHRNQDPENFDAIVKALTKEDQDFRNYVEPTSWTEVPVYRELEKFFKDRVSKTAKSRDKRKNQKGVLQDAQVSAILQALFIKDRNTAARMAYRYGLGAPNASLITVEDVANWQYGNVKEWSTSNTLPKGGTTATGAYNAMARTVQLTLNASVEDVFHELYHDFLANIAPLVLSDQQYLKLQSEIERMLAQKDTQKFLTKRYKVQPGEFTFFDAAGNISVAAQEVFAQMMTSWHFEGNPLDMIDPLDQGVLNTITDYHQQLFQDLGRSPIATVSDDSSDLFANFWVTPPALRREAFKPENRQERVNDEIIAQTLDISQLADGIENGTDYTDPGVQSIPAQPQILADRLKQDYQPGEQPEDGVPFTLGGHIYVIEGDQVYEVISTPGGPQRIPRQMEEVPWDGQTLFPPGTVAAGTMPVSEENLEQTGASEVAVGPVKIVTIPAMGPEPEKQVLTDSGTGMVIATKPKRKRKAKAKKEWSVPEPDVPEGDRETLYSIQDGQRYTMGRMNKRIVSGKYAISKVLERFAKDDANKYPVGVRQAIIDLVTERMVSKNNLLDAVRDVYALLRKSPDQRSRVFDPDNKYGGIGLAATTYYLHALQSELNLVVMGMENDQDVDIDQSDAVLLMQAVNKRLARENLEAGRAVDINKNLLSLTPDQTLGVLQSNLVRNNAAFKRYVRRALAFGRKFNRQNLTSQEFDQAMKVAKIPAFLKPALLLYNKPDGNIRDFETEAEKAWLENPRLAGMIKPESKARIRQLAEAAQAVESSFISDYFAQQWHLAVESERGIAIVDALNSMFYNTMLLAFGTTKINVTGSFVQYWANMMAFGLAMTAQDVKGQKLGAPIKNAMALAKGMDFALRSLPEASLEAAAVAISGQRGASVEAFELAQGSIPISTALLYARPGTAFADNSTAYKRATHTVRRLASILLFDAGRRNVTAPDAFAKILAENTMLGAFLYREAWDSYYAEKPDMKRSDYIAQEMDKALKVGDLAHFQAEADKVIDRYGDLILAGNISPLNPGSERAILRNIFAFNLRREAREKSINPQFITDARRQAYATSFSNTPRGMAGLINTFLGQIPKLGPLSKILEEVSATHEGFTIDWLGEEKTFGKDFRWRAFGGGAVAPGTIPFAGNISRMLEAFWNWSPIGIANVVSTNAYQGYKNRDNVNFDINNNPDTYSQLEVAATIVRGIIGTTAIAGIATMLCGGGDDEEKEMSMTGHRDKSVWGKNGKEFFIPAYCFWFRKPDGSIVYINYGEHPALLATFGVAATFAERFKNDPEVPWIGLVFRAFGSYMASAGDVGAYEGIIDLARGFESYDKEKPFASMYKTMVTNNAKFAKAYAIPLNRIQKEQVAFAWLGGRGYEVVPQRGEFMATVLANTWIEGMLSEEQHNALDRVMGPDGKPKQNYRDAKGFQELLSARLGGVINPAPPGMLWMVQNNYYVQREDWQKPISGLFTKPAQREQAEAEFAQMNNGMFFVKHASEIEKKSSTYYWPWIESYSKDEKRQAEIQAFVNSETNQLKKRQNSPAYKTERDIQQADINSIVTQARSIGALQAASDYYTDNPRVKLWSQTIAIRKIQEGYELSALNTNKLLEQRASQAP